MTNLEVQLAYSIRYCALREEAVKLEQEALRLPAGDARDELAADALWARAAMLAIEQEIL